MSQTSFKIALVGSSGGGSATLSSGELVIENIQKNVNNIFSTGLSIGKSFNKQQTSVSVPLVSITEVAFVQSSSGLDFISNAQSNDSTKLWVMESGGSLEKKYSGSLYDVNQHLMIQDIRIAELIYSNKIDAVITISSDPEGANKVTIAAAINKNIPIIGTGGTSLSCIGTLGGNVIGCSGGSVATTGITRGICIAASLASYPPWGSLDFNLPERPRFPKFRSVVGAALPILLSVSLLKVTLSSYGLIVEYWSTLCSQSPLNPIMDRIIKQHDVLSYPFLCLCRGLSIKFSGTSVTLGVFLGNSISRWHIDILYSLEQKVLPVVISAITCMEVSRLEELSLLTGAAAGALVSGSIICAFLSGTLCGHLFPWLLVKCSKMSLLPTSATIISVGASAMISGLIASILCSTIKMFSIILSSKTYEIISFIANYVFGSISLGFSIFGCILGWLISWGSEEGYYHFIMLPLIALNMESGNFSLFGTLDMICLCLPCAGVCSAVYMVSALTALKEKNEVLNCAKKGKESDRTNKIEIFDDLCDSALFDSLSGEFDQKGINSKKKKKRKGQGTNTLNNISSSRSSDKFSKIVNNDISRNIDSSSSNSVRFLRNGHEKNIIDSSSFHKMNLETQKEGEIANRASMESTNISLPASDRKTYQHHMNLGSRGTVSNLLMGDFVEACYPYSQGNRWVLLSVRVASSVASSLLFGYLGMETTEINCVSSSSNLVSSVFLSSGAGITIGSCKNSPFQSSAYLPLPLMMLIASIGSDVRTPTSTSTSSQPSAPFVLISAVLIAYILPFLITFIVYNSEGKLNLKS